MNDRRFCVYSACGKLVANRAGDVMLSAQWLVEIGKIWIVAGGVVAAAFLLIGIDRFDPGARHAYAFRPLLVPAILLLWPLVLLRWAAAGKAN